VQSESHYSCIFSLDARALQADPGRIDLYWYDELGQQDEIVKLTITTGAAGEDKAAADDDDEISPIDEMIRTKWGAQAHVDWNGAEKML